MPLINLIQEQRAHVHRKEREARILVISTVAIGALSFLTSAAFVLETGRAGLEAVALQQRKKKLAPMLERLEQNQRTIAELDPRLKTLQTAVTDSQKWERVLGHLKVNTPEGIYLNGIKCQQNDPTQGTVVQFTGNSRSLDEIGSYVMRLELSEDLEDVAMKFAQERVGADRSKALEFEILATVSGTKQAKKTLKKDQEGEA
jgi:Tfp pilus assembly protein PilN